MKRIKWMRLSGGLLVLTLITSCFVGGTFAKYVSKGEGTDTARVAKWGVEVAVTGDGFRTEYSKNEANTTTVSGNTVISASPVGNPDKVVAPGTKGTFGGVNITGTPEVAVKINTVAEVKLSGWNIGTKGEFYCPLVFTIGDTTICGLHYSAENAGGEESFEWAIKKAIQDATTKEFEAGTNLSEVGKDITYSWAWPFENSDHFKNDSGRTACDKTDSESTSYTSYHVCEQTDRLDTILGNNAADNDPDNDPKVEITVTTTVTQID